MDMRHAGRRVLVVEDEVLIAITLEDMLDAAGYTVVGPFGRVAEALRVAQAETIDAALLDVNVAGEKVFPVAFALEKRGVPFLLLTGYGQSALPRERTDWAVCPKPFHEEELIDWLARMVATV